MGQYSNSYYSVMYVTPAHQQLLQNGSNDAIVTKRKYSGYRVTRVVIVQNSRYRVKSAVTIVVALMQLGLW